MLTRQLFRSTHEPEAVPFLETRSDLRRVFWFKDKESRIALAQEALAPILSSWKLRSGGQGLLFKPIRYGGTSGGRPSFMRQHTLRRCSSDGGATNEFAAGSGTR